MNVFASVEEESQGPEEKSILTRSRGRIQILLVSKTKATHQIAIAVVKLLREIWIFQIF